MVIKSQACQKVKRKKRQLLAYKTAPTLMTKRQQLSMLGAPRVRFLQTIMPRVRHVISSARTKPVQWNRVALAIISLLLLFLYHPPFGQAGTGWFTQSNWTGAASSTTSVTPSGIPGSSTWQGKASADTNLDSSMSSLKLKFTENSYGDDATNTSTGSGFSDTDAAKNLTEVIDNKLVLSRVTGGTGAAQYIKGASNAFIPAGTGTDITTTSIVKDNSNGLHILYYDATKKKMYYRYSASANGVWQPPSGSDGIDFFDTLKNSIPSTSWPLVDGVRPPPNNYGQATALTVDSANQRLYAVFRVRYTNTTNVTKYNGAVFATCSYASAGNSCTTASNWKGKLLGVYTTYTDVMVSAVTITLDARSRVNIAYVGLGTATYFFCKPQATDYCASSTWTQQSVGTWASRNMRLVADTVSPMADKYLYLLEQLSASGNTSMNVYYCKVSSDTSCGVGADWTRVKLRDFNVAGGDRFIDGAVSNVGELHIVYDIGTTYYQYGTTETNQCTIDGIGTSIPFSIQCPIEAQLDYSNCSNLSPSPVRINANNVNRGAIFATCQDNYDIYIFRNSVYSNGERLYQSNGTGLSFVLTNPDPAYLSYAMLYYNSSGLTFLIVPYVPSGSFTSRRISSPTAAKLSWTGLEVKLAGTKPQGTTVAAKLSALDTTAIGKSSPDTDFCDLGSSPSVSTDTNGNQILTFSISDCPSSTVTVPSRYLRYRLTFTSDTTTHTTAPVITSVQATYANYASSAALVSSPYQMVTDQTQEPVVSQITWDEQIPAGSTAKVQVQVRTRQNNNLFDDVTDPWCGPGTTCALASAPSQIWYQTSATSSGSCTRAPDPNMPGYNLVTCDVDSGSPVNVGNNSQNKFLQYRIVLTSDGDRTATVGKISLQFSVNSPPTVTDTIARAQSDGTVSVTYSLHDADQDSFNVGLFYDVELTLLSPIGLNDQIISVDAHGLGLGDLLPAEGVILIDQEQIKYFHINGNSFNTRPVLAGDLLSGKELVRGAWSSKASHAAGATIWVRATDSVIQDDADFTPTGKVAVATGTGVGLSVGCSHLITCTNLAISWRPADDIKGRIYKPSRSLAVVASDKQTVRSIDAVTTGLHGSVSQLCVDPLNTATCAIDTKAPVLGSSLGPTAIPELQGISLKLMGTGTQTTSTGYKANTGSLVLVVALPDSSSDNGASLNKFSLCRSGPGQTNECNLTPAITAFTNTQNTVNQWQTLASFTSNTTCPAGVDSAKAICRSLSLMSDGKWIVNVVAADNVGNIGSVSSTNIIVDTTKPAWSGAQGNNPQITAQDASNATVQSMILVSWQALLPTNTTLIDGSGNTDFAYYRLYRNNMPISGTCPSASAFCELIALPNIAQNSHPDTTVQHGTSYQYRIVAEDNMGQQSLTNTYVTTAVDPNPVGNVPPPTPSISNVSLTNCSYTSATITWTTSGTAGSDSSDSVVVVAPTPTPTPPRAADFDNPAYSTQGNATPVIGAHTVDLIGLSQGSHYYFQVRSTAPGGTAGKYPSSDTDTPIYCHTLTAPVPVAPVITPASPPWVTTSRTATLNWTTSGVSGSDPNADQFVEYGPTEALGTYYGSETPLGTIHSVTVPGLTPSTSTTPSIYAYQLHSTTADGGEAIYPTACGVGDPACHFTMQIEESSPIPPQPKNVNHVVSGVSVTITWQTDSPGTPYVQIWEDADQTTARTLPISPLAPTTSPQITISGLKPHTVYDYYAISYDSNSPPQPYRSNAQGQFTTESDSRYADSPTITNLRNGPPTNSTVTIYYTVNQDVGTTIYYSIDNYTYDEDPQSFPLSPTGNQANTLLGLVAGKQYYYKVRVQNPDPSTPYTESSDCGGGPNTCIFTTTLDTGTRPVIDKQSIRVTRNVDKQNRISISWTTAAAGNSLVEFGHDVDPITGQPSYGRTVGHVNDYSSTQHSVDLPYDLIENRTYYFRLYTRDRADTPNQLEVFPTQADLTDNTCNNPNPAPATCKNPTFTTIDTGLDPINLPRVLPQPKGVAAMLVTDHSAVVGWSTDTLANSELAYGTAPGVYGTPIIQKDANDKDLYTLKHSVKLENLQANSDYWFMVASTSTPEQQSQRVPKDHPDSGDLVDLNLPCANVPGNYFCFHTNSGVGAGDLTQEEYDAMLQRLQELEGKEGAGTLTAAEKAELERLRATLNMGGNRNDVSPPLISGVEVSDITETQATVTWNTNEQSTSVVQFGETDTYGSLAGDASNLTTAHNVILKKLDPGTDYNFRVVSLDRDGNSANSSNYTFKTKGVKGEKTDEKEPGDEKDGEPKKKGKDELDEATKRIQELSKEKKLSVEKILELLKDFAEADVSKILSSLGIQLVSPPKFVGGAPRVEVTIDSATISWQTDKESDSRVAFAAADKYRPDKDDPYQTEAGDTASFVSDHEVAITGLTPGTLYHYQVRSREPAGRTARSTDRTFKTLPLKPEVSGLGLVETTERTVTFTWKTNVPTKTTIDYTNRVTKATRSQGDPQLVTVHRFTLSGLEPNTAYEATVRAEDESGLSAVSKLISFATGRDTKPPEVNKVRTDVTLSPGKSEFAQAIVTWTTDEPATSQVLYEEGITQSPELKNSTPENTEHLLNHVVVLNKLRPATVYRFRVVSSDPAGNKAASRDYTLLTPQKKETVLEIIIKNFEETFGFLKTLGR